MSKIKLIALDIDGTLMNSQREISQHNIDLIRRAERAGIVVVLATGRMYRSANQFAYIFENDMPVISYNGGLIRMFNDGRVLFQKNLPNEFAKPIFSLHQDYGLATNFYVGDKLIAHKSSNQIQAYSEHINVPYVSVDDDELERIFTRNDIIKMAALGDEDKIQAFLDQEKHKFTNDLHVVKSLPNFLEFIHKDVNKGSALVELGKILNIHPDQMMACGDNLNDLEMLESVGYPVIMGNGNQDMMNRGWFITTSNDEDGVAQAIEQLAL